MTMTVTTTPSAKDCRAFVHGHEDRALKDLSAGANP